MTKLIVILGPTSAGKSSLAIKLAKKFQGEIVSADSRQVYKGMDLGTGKVTRKEQRLVPHHLLDVVSPKKQFTIAEFKPLAEKAIEQIQGRGRLPFLVGGTPFYIYATIDGWNIPEVRPSPKLRQQLDKKTTAELSRILAKLDPDRSLTIDQHNRVRLIRAIEIVKSTGKPVPRLETRFQSQNSILILGIQKDLNQLYKLIDQRLDRRLKQGLISEIRKLHQQGVSYKRLFGFGLEYRFVSEYLRGRLDYDTMREQLQNAIHRFAKRQMTWFKTDSRINWIKNQKQAEKLIKSFVKKTA